MFPAELYGAIHSLATSQRARECAPHFMTWLAGLSRAELRRHLRAGGRGEGIRCEFQVDLPTLAADELEEAIGWLLAIAHLSLESGERLRAAGAAVGVCVGSDLPTMLARFCVDLAGALGQSHDDGRLPS